MRRTFLTVFCSTENQDLLPKQAESNLPSLVQDFRAVKENKSFVVTYPQNVENWVFLPPAAREPQAAGT